MSSKKGGKTKRHLLLAKPVVNGEKRSSCVFCSRDVDDEVIYGKLYAIGDIQCHYFCVLLSCCLVQKGKDDEGLFGFLYPDIIAEVERSKKHKCSYCGRDGATLGCTVAQCRKQFHLPCGRERNAVSLFYGNFKSFCERHAPRQRIKEEIMAKVRLRKRAKRISKLPQIIEVNKDISIVSDSAMGCNEMAKDVEQTKEAEAVCVICYESVDGYPTPNTFWPPCCARDAWFHRSCLQRMALSAGMHYLKCPLCNRKEAFYEAVMSQGYYVPDRDASWELEQNAFAEIYERPITCSAADCICPMGRDYDAETGAWDIRLCILCGSSGMHAQCQSNGNDGSAEDGSGSFLRYVCPTCSPAAPEDLDKLVVDTVNPPAVVAPPSVRGRPMPCRMSLRRTKQRALRHQRASCSDGRLGIPSLRTAQENEETEASRLDLNLHTPKKPDKRLIDQNVLRNVENKLLSPLKLLEQGLYERISSAEVANFELDSGELLAQMRDRFSKPKPLVEKKKIVNDILESVLESIQMERKKTKEPLKEWNSPKKCTETKIEEEQAENKPPETNLDSQMEDCDHPPTKRSRIEPSSLREPSSAVALETQDCSNRPEVDIECDVTGAGHDLRIEDLGALVTEGQEQRGEVLGARVLEREGPRGARSEGAQSIDREEAHDKGQERVLETGDTEGSVERNAERRDSSRDEEGSQRGRRQKGKEGGPKRGPAGRKGAARRGARARRGAAEGARLVQTSIRRYLLC